MKQLTRKEKLVAAAVIIMLIALAGVVVYSQVMIVAPEHVTGNPLPTPSPSPSPSPTPEPLELHLLSTNNTDPFYQGWTVHMEWQLSEPLQGINVTLYNNGAVRDSALTDASGTATFDRVCFNPFDFTAAAEIPP